MLTLKPTGKNSGERPAKTEAPPPDRPINMSNLMAFKARDGRPRRGFLHGRSSIVKLGICLIPLAAVISLVSLGCGDTKKPTAANNPSALDVGPVGSNTAVTTTPPAYTPPPATPTYTPPAYTPPPAARTTTPEAPAATAGGVTYTVQKGDTLSKIARDHYGDQSKWKKIAAANPGINENAIKVGQKIVIP